MYIDTWYEQKKDHLRHITISKKLKISLDEAKILSNMHWDIMTSKNKEEWLNILDENMGDKSKIMGLDYKELEISHPKIVTELLEFGIFGSDSSRQIAYEKEEAQFTMITPEDDGLFDISKIRELIFQNTHKSHGKKLVRLNLGCLCFLCFSFVLGPIGIRTPRTMIPLNHLYGSQPWVGGQTWVGGLRPLWVLVGVVLGH